MARYLGKALKEHSEYGHVSELQDILKKVDVHLIDDPEEILVFQGKPTKKEIDKHRET